MSTFDRTHLINFKACYLILGHGQFSNRQMTTIYSLLLFCTEAVSFLPYVLYGFWLTIQILILDALNIAFVPREDFRCFPDISLMLFSAYLALDFLIFKTLNALLIIKT